MTPGVSPSDLDGWRQRILAELQSLGDDAAQARAAASTVVLDQTSIGRVSRMDAMQQQAMAVEMLQRQVVRERKLRAALERLDAGTYGRCCACDAALETGHLAADPAAVFCADCLAEREAG